MGACRGSGRLYALLFARGHSPDRSAGTCARQRALPSSPPNFQLLMEELESKIKDAEENLGEQEVRDALLAKADYLASVGDKDAATAAFDAAEAKTTGFGNKMDLVFSQIRWEWWHVAFWKADRFDGDLWGGLG
eukprot:355364-Chlamydomonas_euryale.AAC.3